MRLLLFSDLHCDVEAASRLVAKAETVDVVVGAGDFGNMRRNVGACIEVLQSIDRPAVLVPGNNESLEELQAVCRGWSHAHVLHGEGLELSGVSFYGIGGGIPVTPFGEWSFDFSEEQATELLRNCPRNPVLVSHSPPRGAVDRSSSSRDLGSSAVRAAIERLAPRLVVCGHIHACAGQQEFIGDTPVVNAGPQGVVWELE